MAYNEQANIADALVSILGQRLVGGRRIAELIVVASGCEDQTCAIVADIARGDGRVRLIEQERRQGKASAINLFITAASSPVLVMASADLVVKEGALEVLLRHFDDPAVGMVGGHPTPVNGEGTFLGHAVHLQWRLHDRIALKSPKLGELVAFRNVVPSIPLDTAVDELSLQAVISQLGYRLVYEPGAVVYNRGPATVPDFLRQRRRIHAGHLLVQEQQAYRAPTMSLWPIASAMWGAGSFATARAAMWTVGTIGLEAAARVLGAYDAARQQSSPVWEISATTKQHVSPAANADGHNVAIFHIVDFHRQQLEVGVHASRLLTRRVADHIRQTLGCAATVAIQQAGTVVAMLPGDQEKADVAAREFVRQFEAAPVLVSGRRGAPPPTLAYAIVAFPPAGPPLTRFASVPVARPPYAAATAASLGSSVS